MGRATARARQGKAKRWKRRSKELLRTKSNLRWKKARNADKIVALEELKEENMLQKDKNIEELIRRHDEIERHIDKEMTETLYPPKYMWETPHKLLHSKLKGPKQVLSASKEVIESSNPTEE